MTEPLLDPDCRAGKHGSCVGDPCACACHGPPEPNDSAWADDQPDEADQ